MFPEFKFSEKLVSKIKELHKEEHNIILSDSEAQEYLHSYVDLFDFVVGK